MGSKSGVLRGSTEARNHISASGWGFPARPAVGWVWTRVSEVGVARRHPTTAGGTARTVAPSQTAGRPHSRWGGGGTTGTAIFFTNEVRGGFFSSTVYAYYMYIIPFQVITFSQGLIGSQIPALSLYYLEVRCTARKYWASYRDALTVSPLAHNVG